MTRNFIFYFLKRNWNFIQTNLSLLDNNNIINKHPYHNLSFINNKKDQDKLNQEERKNININIININKEQINTRNYSSSCLNKTDTNKVIEHVKYIKDEIVPEDLNEKNEEDEEENMEENEEIEDNEDIEEIQLDPELEKIKTKVIKNFDNKIKEFGEYITEEKFNKLENNITFNKIEENLDKIIFNYNKYIKCFIRPALLFNKDKSIYKGSWNFQGEKEGYGIFYDIKGNKYIGEWKKDKFDGKGRIISLNGDCYDGDFKEGIIEGYGIFISTKGGYNYTGEFKNNKFHGRGKLIYDDNTTYEGYFSDGYMHGEGNLLFKDGSYYKGNFDKNNYNGKGKFYFHDGRKYNGDWKNSIMDGEGVFSWDDDTKYKGTYKNNVREGNGVYSFGANLYDGHWINNMPHGEGTLLNDGLRIVGEFRYGKMVEIIESKGVNRDISQKFTLDKNSFIKPEEIDKKSSMKSGLKTYDTDGNIGKHHKVKDSLRHHHHKDNRSNKSKEHKKHKDSKNKEKSKHKDKHKKKNSDNND